MDVTALATAYAELLAHAESITDETPLDAPTRADVAWRLCHIALADRIIANAARDQINGRTATVDNQPSMDPNRITLMINTTTHAQRIDNVRRNWAELRPLLETFSAVDTEAKLKLRMHDRNGEYMSDTILAWSALVDMRTTQNIPGHRDALSQTLPEA
ncbi:hypothetical protein AB0C61_15180 [Streptomyces sp. NPDC048680]|uniref:DinB family protein n=1 Tax=Streptomyces sp. NPDC048680 TaxID=3155492 RepID=UPI003417AA72